MKKYLISALALATFIGVISFAGAEDAASTPQQEPPMRQQPMVLEIGAAGRVLLRGTIDSLGTNSVTVKSWGGNWNVNISASTKVMPGGDVSKFAQGDFVGVQGTVNQNSAWTIDATLLRDWTYKQAVQQQERQNQQAVQQLMRASEPRNWQGNASNVNASGNSLTLTINGTAYTVNFSSGAKFVNRIWQTITLSNVSDGDTVRVFGANSNGTITASVLRDVSLPAQTH